MLTTPNPFQNCNPRGTIEKTKMVTNSKAQTGASPRISWNIWWGGSTGCGNHTGTFIMVSTLVHIRWTFATGYSHSSAPPPLLMHHLSRLRPIPSQVVLILSFISLAGYSSHRLMPYGDVDRAYVCWAGKGGCRLWILRRPVPASAAVVMEKRKLEAHCCRGCLWN
jgi:hypothetical protein